MPRSRHILSVLLTAFIFLLLTPTSAPAAPPGPPAPTAPEQPNPKTTAPETDLGTYPKRTDVPGSRPAEPGHVEDVLTVEKHGDGSTTTTFYTPAPGVPSQALAGRLRAQGHRNVQVITHDPAAATGEVSIMAADSCSYGSARTVACPPWHWRNNGYHDPQVYFNDHTAAQWPVNASVYTWHQTVGIDSYYRWNSCPTTAGVHCVNVYNGNYGDTDWAGLTTLAADSSGNLLDGRVYVRFNDYYYYNADGYRQTACHELGHALGLGHNAQNYGCLWYQIVNSGHRAPEAEDHNMLTSIYSVVR